jgi:hypothetical protein
LGWRWTRSRPRSSLPPSASCPLTALVTPALTALTPLPCGPSSRAPLARWFWRTSRGGLGSRLPCTVFLALPRPRRRAPWRQKAGGPAQYAWHPSPLLATPTAVPETFLRAPAVDVAPAQMLRILHLPSDQGARAAYFLASACSVINACRTPSAYVPLSISTVCLQCLLRALCNFVSRGRSAPRPFACFSLSFLGGFSLGLVTRHSVLRLHDLFISATSHGANHQLSVRGVCLCGMSHDLQHESSQQDHEGGRTGPSGR